MRIAIELESIILLVLNYIEPKIFWNKLIKRTLLNTVLTIKFIKIRLQTKNGYIYH